MPILNGFQKSVLKTYAGGDFAHYIEIDEQGKFRDDHEFRDELAVCGDTLLRFLMVELSEEEGCDSIDEACNRTRSAIEDLTGALDSLEIDRLPTLPTVL